MICIWGRDLPDFVDGCFDSARPGLIGEFARRVADVSLCVRDGARDALPLDRAAAEHDEPRSAPELVGYWSVGHWIGRRILR